MELLNITLLRMQTMMASLPEPVQVIGNILFWTHIIVFGLITLMLCCWPIVLLSPIAIVYLLVRRELRKNNKPVFNGIDGAPKHE